MRLDHRLILITGATSGLGRAMAERFVADGARVIAVARRKELLDELEEKYKGKLLPILLDVRDRESVERTLGGLPAGWREIDGLVNNAGLALGLEMADKADLDQWETMIDTNVKGLTYCTHALLPGMVERGRGHVVNIGSVSGNYAYPGGNVYGATKAYVKQFSANLRAELLGKNIRVTNIEPGMVDTEFSLVRFDGDKERASKVYADTKPLHGEDIAEAAAWILSQPDHVNVSRIEIFPTTQANGPFAVHRKNA